MGKIKRKIRLFGVPDWQQEEEWLREQHKKGLKFVRYNLIYVFEECEPEDVVYQLDFKGGDRDHEEYIQMFKDCGWEYLQDFAGYSYFRKPAREMKENEEGIFCDEESRLEMIKNVYRQKVLPLIIIFLSIIVPQLCIIIPKHISQASNHDALFNALSIVFTVMFLIYIIYFIKFGYKYWKIKQSVRK